MSSEFQEYFRNSYALVNDLCDPANGVPGNVALSKSIIHSRALRNQHWAPGQLGVSSEPFVAECEPDTAVTSGRTSRRRARLQLAPVFQRNGVDCPPLRLTQKFLPKSRGRDNFRRVSTYAGATCNYRAYILSM